jgi:hypothetical protein
VQSFKIIVNTYDSIQPQLSMTLAEYSGMLYLQIKNSGKLAAKDIRISDVSIENNGTHNELNLGALFQNAFELYPEETVQDEIAIFDTSLCEIAFPRVSLSVEYKVGKQLKKQKYSRTVTFVKAYSCRISADINIDTSKRDDALKAISRASLRVANYLDGHQLAPFDEVDLLAGKSLQNDLVEAAEFRKIPVQQRTETLKRG